MAKTQKKTYQTYGAYRENLAYDYASPARRHPQRKPQIRTIKRPKIFLRPAEQVPVATICGFAVAGFLLCLILAGYAQMTVLSDRIVTLQSSLTQLQTENVKLTTEYERTFDLNTVEAAARSAGMSKPGAGQIFYLDSENGDRVSVYSVSSNGLESFLLSVKDGVCSALAYFS